MQHYPRAKLLRLDALAAVAAWAFGLVALVAQGAAWFLVPSLAVAAKAAAGLFLVAAGAHVVLAFLHRCPACGKHPTVQGLGPVHPASMSQSRLSGWSGAIWNVFRRKQVVCIHCGSGFYAQ